MTLLEIEKIKQHKNRLHQVTFIATLGGFLFGYDTGVINGALTSLKIDMQLTAYTEGLVMSVLLTAAALGALFGGKLSDIYGRKQYLIFLATIFFVGALASALSPTIIILLIARFILGFAVGGASVAAPTFISELSPAELRGKLTGLNEVAIAIGASGSFFINALIGNVWGHIDHIWRYMLIVQAIPAIFLFIGMLKAPESPRWLISQGRFEEALSILKDLRNDELQAQQEYDEIVQLLKDKGNQNLKLLNWLKLQWVRKILLIGIIFAMVQQTTGVNVIIYYGTEILVQSGWSLKMALIANMLNGVTCIMGQAIGVLYFVSRYNRKTIINFGYCSMAIIHLFIAVISYLITGTPKILSIWIGGAVFTLVMQGTLGFMTWVVLAELFPLKLRGVGIGIAAFFNWIMNAVIAYLFPLGMTKLGMSPLFLIFSIVNFITIIFIVKCLPETKQRSLEQLEHDLSKGIFN